MTKEQKKIQLCLAKIASRKGYLTYSELCSQANLPYDMGNIYHRNLLQEDLGEVSRIELDEFGRPMLSCIVVVGQTGYPGKGFFRWAEYLYQIKIYDELLFLSEEMNDTHAFWSSAEGKAEIERLEKLL